MNASLFNKNLLIYLWVGLMVVLILTTSPKREIKENFVYNLPRYCGNCGYNDRTSCAGCTDCGYCINKFGYGECIPGDSRGPYFRDDCMYWEYDAPLSYYYRYPYSHLYPIISVGDYYPFPYSHIFRKTSKRRRRFRRKRRLHNLLKK